MSFCQWPRPQDLPIPSPVASVFGFFWQKGLLGRSWSLRLTLSGRWSPPVHLCHKGGLCMNYSPAPVSHEHLWKMLSVVTYEKCLWVQTPFVWAPYTLHTDLTASTCFPTIYWDFSFYLLTTLCGRHLLLLCSAIGNPIYTSHLSLKRLINFWYLDYMGGLKLQVSDGSRKVKFL